METLAFPDVLSLAPDPIESLLLESASSPRTKMAGGYQAGGYRTEASQKGCGRTASMTVGACANLTVAGCQIRSLL